MKHLILLSLAILFIAFQAKAQGPNRGGTPEEFANRQTKQMTELLSLSEKQQEQVAALNLKYAKKRDEQRKEAVGDREAMREKMKTMRTERQKELKEILSEEQYNKYIEFEKERFEKRRQNGQGQGRGQGFGRQ